MTGRPFYADSAVTIWHGDALALPFPDGSVDLVVTSPPYFGLRSYTDGGQHYAGQVGSEPTPREYVDALIAATREMARVLKPSGSVFINLGDKYAGGGGFSPDSPSNLARRSDEAHQQGSFTVSPSLKKRLKGGGVPAGRASVPAKSLMGLPWRYALRCVDELGLILRAEVIWSKPNGLPESVTDRVRRSHEQWFHFTPLPRYYSAVDEIREGYAPETAARYAYSYRSNSRIEAGAMNGSAETLLAGGGPSSTNPLGKLPGSVWTIPTQPLRVPWGYGVEAGRIARYFTDERDAFAWLRLSHRTRRRRIRQLPDHFAAFPLELPRRIIRGWSPTGICTACGEGRRPAVATNGVKTPEKWHDVLSGGQRTRVATGGGATRLSLGVPASAQQRTITGYACACDLPTAATRPAVVLDPFGGTCTTALAARAEGRVGWAVDLSADYCRLGRWRVTDPGELARALEVRKPPPAPTDTDALFDLEGA